MDHILGHKTSLNKFEKIQSMFTGHIKLSENSITEKNLGNSPNIWELYNTILNKPGVKEKNSKANQMF